MPHGPTGEKEIAKMARGGMGMGDARVKMGARELFPGEAGLLGNGTLSRYRVTIDGIRMRLVLEPAMQDIN